MSCSHPGRKRLKRRLQRSRKKKVMMSKKTMMSSKPSPHARSEMKARGAKGRKGFSKKPRGEMTGAMTTKHGPSKKKEPVGPMAHMESQRLKQKRYLLPQILSTT